MRRFAIAAMLCASVAFAGSIKDLDFKNGFRDAIFGAKITEFKGAYQVEGGEGRLRMYERPADKMSIGAAPLASIRYAFYRGRLVAVYIKTDNNLASLALLTALEAAYGPGARPSPQTEKRNWTGQNVLLTYDVDASTGAADVQYHSVEWTKKMLLDQKKNAQSAASDL